MRYEYFCQSCEAVSPEQREREVDAEDELVVHRREAHGGLKPDDGDGVRRVRAEDGGGCLPTRPLWAIVIVLLLFLANCWGR